MAIFTSTGYTRKYCLLHPWKVVMHKCQDIKCAWQRATKGYCFRDLWSIDDWFLQIMPKMLDEYIEIHHGYPSDMTDEEWVEIVNKIAKSFRNAHKEMTEFMNPYNEEYLSALNFDLENGKFESTASDELEENFRGLRKGKRRIYGKIP